jgi:cold shock CspA family protein
MGRSQESFYKKEVRKKKEKKRLEKEKKRQARKEGEKSSLDDMIAYVDADGNITSTPPDPGQKEDIDIESIEVSVPKTDAQNGKDYTRQGRVAFFDNSKGYGFIRDGDTGDSVFVHVNDLLDEISEGNIVSYEVVKGKKGPAAVRVQRVK